MKFRIQFKLYISNQETAELLIEFTLVYSHHFSYKYIKNLSSGEILSFS